MKKRRAYLRSILQYLPLVANSSSLVWPPPVEEELQTMSRGPSESMKISREESANFFGEVVPGLCELLLQLPSILEMHYRKADHVLDGVLSGLRLLVPPEAGIVFFFFFGKRLALCFLTSYNQNWRSSSGTATSEPPPTYLLFNLYNLAMKHLELYKKLVEYSSERLSRRTWLGFFSWLISTSLSSVYLEDQLSQRSVCIYSSFLS
ncbi:unnamed protein product [Arabidopsis lyrata]|uniref:Predicted protein n=1 Tax=Arabidopsis lyrata subsp. lyrata TaxID=81972 RepID=D7LDN7_ARALL|nr:predicted protein [Arabidopsis lyrata subsp. lyrata]CAH8264400.1 unnamed protein product [Arabidopsis lyrata]